MVKLALSDGMGGSDGSNGHFGHGVIHGDGGGGYGTIENIGENGSHDGSHHQGSEENDGLTSERYGRLERLDMAKRWKSFQYLGVITLIAGSVFMIGMSRSNTIFGGKKSVVLGSSASSSSMSLSSVPMLKSSKSSYEIEMEEIGEVEEVPAHPLGNMEGMSGCPFAKQQALLQQQAKPSLPLPEQPSQDLKKILGPLSSLVGTWVSSERSGLSIVALPKRNTHPEDTGKFELVVRPYKEVFRIEAIGDGVRNRGGGVEQFSGVLTYYKEVIATDEDPGPIHIENGMFFYLSHIQDYTTGGPTDEFVAPYSIGRTATVPHGNNAFLFGNYKTYTSDDKNEKELVVPMIPDIDARALDFGTDKKGTYNKPYDDSPYEAINPNKLLQDVVKGQNIISTTHIKLDSKNDGNVVNTPFVNRYANTSGFRAEFWIEEILEEDGSITEQLQYSEIADLLFHKKKGENAGDELISWPHVNVNTLTKVKA